MGKISEKFLEALNPPQREAVTWPLGPVMILAGAGSGKTRVIAFRVAHLVGVREVPARQVLAVTFTNKAAREMRERVAGLGQGRMDLTGALVSTFHSLCVRLLREQGHHLGLTPAFSIYGESDQRGLIRSILGEHGDSALEEQAAEIQSAISMAKNRLIAPEEMPAETPWDKAVQNVYSRYQSFLLAMNACDFDDLLMHSVRLLETHGDVRIGFQQRFRHILVDEFQDTNAAQYALLKLLWGGSGSLAVVGDDDQAIYTWRGAEADMFHRFREDFPTAKTVVLDQNYRSTGHILNCAHQVIEKAPGRHPKRLWSDLGEGEAVRLIRASDAEDEARQVVEDLSFVRYNKSLDFGDFAILIRTNFQTRPFESALRANHIPYVVVGATGFFDRAEVKDLTAYLRVLVNDRDEVALRRAINTPRRGVGAATLAQIASHGKAHSLGLMDALDQVERIESVGKAPAAAIRAFIDMMAELKFAFTHGDMIAAARRLLAETGLHDHWRDEAKDARQAELKSAAAEDVIGMLSRYIDRTGVGEATLTGFLDHLSLLDRLEDEDAARGKVTLMTLHAAKGLEFAHVYFAGLEEGLLPHTRSVTEGREVAEERRLAYVGMTRAKKRLTLSWAERRQRGGDVQARTPSRFLEEIRHLLTEGPDPGQGSEEEIAENFFANIKNMLGK